MLLEGYPHIIFLVSPASFTDVLLTWSDLWVGGAWRPPVGPRQEGQSGRSSHRTQYRQRGRDRGRDWGWGRSQQRNTLSLWTTSGGKLAEKTRSICHSGLVTHIKYVSHSTKIDGFYFLRNLRSEYSWILTTVIVSSVLTTTLFYAILSYVVTTISANISKKPSN